MTNEGRREQISRNYDAFVRLLPQLVSEQRGKFALMHDERVVAFFDTARDAFVAGQQIHPDGMFSVQEVTDAPVDLGYFSHAVPQRAV
jgi:hypothetical protein